MRKLHVFIFCNTPLTIVGLKTLLKDYASNRFEIIFSGCPKRCENNTGFKQCWNCNILEELNTLFLNTEEAMYPDIIFIDDYEFLDNPIKRIEPVFVNDFYSLKRFFELPLFKKDGQTNYINTIILTRHNTALYLMQLLNLGISSLVHIKSTKENIFKAIESTQLGAIYVDSYIKKIIYEYENEIENSPISKLTYRQLEILYETSKGLKNRQIANRLFITVSTVETHKDRIQRILNLKQGFLNSFAIKNKSEIKFLLELSNRDHNNKFDNVNMF